MKDGPERWPEFEGQYRPLLMAIAQQAGLDFHESQEITQNTFITLARALERMSIRQQPGSFRRYLRKVVTSRIRDHWRSRSRRATEVPLDSLPDTETADPAAESQRSEQELAEAFIRVLERLRRTCNPKTIQVLHCLYMEGLSPKETARRLGLSTSSVEQIKCRTREAVQQAWLKESGACPIGANSPVTFRVPGSPTTASPAPEPPPAASPDGPDPA